MERIFFQRASSGFRTVRGEIVRRIQVRLSELGVYDSIIDGIYGDKTEQALIALQNENALTAHGKIDEATWSRLFSANIPDVKQRALQVTGDFEGTGFTKIVGNFDGAGLTWGIIGFTLSNLELQKVLNGIREEVPEVFNRSFGTLTSEIVDMLNSSLPEQMSFANSISLGSSKMKVLPEWSAAFEELGSDPTVQEIELKHTKRYFDIAEKDLNRFGVENELGLGLCFDIAVQNGGIDDREAVRIRKKIEQSLPTTQQELRIIIANVVADNSRPKFVEDVRSRKMTFAIGRGTVHQANYEVKGWGLDDLIMTVI